MERIKVMVSSTVEDLRGERDAIIKQLEKHDFFELVGADPFINASASSSSALKTRAIARECDLYLLILGERFGFELDDGRSATEVEYDVAYKQDPTKILVFMKSGNAEPRQQSFIDRVSDYYSGYWRVEFQYPHQLQDFVNESVSVWLKDRVSLGKSYSYCEHFIRLALHLKPTPDTRAYYSVREDYIELEYCAMGQSHSWHADRRAVYSDFWGSLRLLQQDLDGWCESW